jgi:hypothetical protein
MQRQTSGRSLEEFGLRSGSADRDDAVRLGHFDVKLGPAHLSLMNGHGSISDNRSECTNTHITFKIAVGRVPIVTVTISTASLQLGDFRNRVHSFLVRRLFSSISLHCIIIGAFISSGYHSGEAVARPLASGASQLIELMA